MIEMLWNDINPPLDARVFRVKNINELIMAADFPYSADGVYLSTYEHKNVLLRCHKLHSDHLFSVREYHFELMTEFSDKIVKSLISKGCVVIIKTPDKEYVVATDLGRAIIGGFVLLNLTDDEFNFLSYTIEHSEPMNIYEKYKEDELEIIDGDESA